MEQTADTENKRRVFTVFRKAPTLVLPALVLLLFAGCDRTPPGPVTALTATPGDGQVALAWTNPTDGDLVGVRVQRNTGTYPTSHTDGATVFEGAGTTHTDTTAANGTQYFYALYAYDGNSNYSTTAAQATATPTSADAHVEILEGFSVLNEEIAGVPEEILALAQREELRELLTEAEGLYRAGDPCGSGEVLIALLLPAVQKVRAAAALETAEDLYNSGRMLRYDILSGIPDKGDCPEAERIGIETAAEPEEETNALVIAGAVFSEPLLHTAKVEHDLGSAKILETFTQVEIPGADARLGDPGKPAVPIYRTLVAAPRGSKVELVINPEDFEVAETIAMNLYPTQEEPVDQNGIDPVYGDKPFSLDAAVYDSDAPYPPEPATVQYLGDARDLQIYLLEVSSGQYYPMSNRLDLFKNMRASLNFAGGNGAFVTEAALNPFDNGMPNVLNAVLNKNSLLNYIEYLAPPRVFGEEFMIMTHPDFLDAAMALRDHKRDNGLWTNVFQCGTGSGITGRQTAAEIDNFIQTHYSSVLTKPSYILFLGDAEYIPTFYVNAIGTDWPYAILGAVGVDKCPDFAIGRIPVDTLEQANVVTGKIMAYENAPPFNAAFYNNAAIAAQFQCCRSDTGAGRDQRTFIQVSEFGRNVMANAGKTVQRIYMKTSDGPYGGSTPTAYYDGTDLPDALDAGSGFPWDGDTADIIAAYNAGRFLFMHRDHGWAGGWAHPEFDSGDIDSLANGALQPVVFSVNCASGFFDNETAGGAYGTTVGGVYWAEKLLRKPNAGAVGILGDTRNSPSWANSTLTQGFFDAIWPNAIPTFGGATSKKRLGDILNHGKLYLMSKVGFEVMGGNIDSASANNELYLWHVLGDPTMKIRTNNPILISPIILYRELTFGINLQYPQEGAEVTVFQRPPTGGDPEPIARGFIVGGTATAEFIGDRNPQYPLEFVASLDDSVVVPLEAKSIN